MKVKDKINDFESFDIMFFIHLTKQNAGELGWPLKLLNCRHSKVCLTRSMSLRPNGCIFSAVYAPSQIFLQESYKATAWWEHRYCYSVLEYQYSSTLR